MAKVGGILGTEKSASTGASWRKHIRVSLVIIPIVLIAILISFNEQVDVDINTGELRFSKSVLQFRVSTHVEKTWLSTHAEVSSATPSWQITHRFTIFSRVSKRYPFSGARAQIDKLEVFCEQLVKLPEDAKRLLARELLRRWQGDDYDANLFIMGLTEAAMRLNEEGTRPSLSTKEIEEVLRSF